MLSKLLDFELVPGFCFSPYSSFCLQRVVHIQLKPEAVLPAEGRAWVSQELQVPFPALPQPLCLWQWLLILFLSTYQHSLSHSEVSRWTKWIFGCHRVFLTLLELLLQETILRCRERGKDQSSEGVLRPPKYTYLNFLNSLALAPFSSDVLKDM